MPQLDVFLWFSQVFWLLVFFICFLSFIFILYVPMTYYIEGIPSLKKKGHFIFSNGLFLSYSSSIQDFFYTYGGRY